MEQPFVIGYHLIWTAYGWWLPNDPRGSGSHLISSDVIAELGELHHGRKRIQPPGAEIREFYQRAREVLLFPLLSLDAGAREEVGRAFGEVIENEQYTCYGCAVMPDHVHILLRKHKHPAEAMGQVLKKASRARLLTTGHRPTDHPTWCGGGVWKVYLDHPNDLRRTIPYIERNPLPLRLPPQEWPFVKPYDGWPLHPGHSPNSPYVKRLRAAGRYP